MPQEFDLIIVGAGLAGAMAALTASEQGLKVLLIEKNGVIGNPVRCGEFLPDANEMVTLLPRVSSFDWLFRHLDTSTICNKTSSIHIYSPLNSQFIIPFEGLILNRDKLTQAIVTKAEHNGTTLWLNTTPKSLIQKKNGVILTLQNQNTAIEVSGKILIGADGFPSWVARHAGLRSQYHPGNTALCVQQHLTDLKSEVNQVEMYFGTQCSPQGYAWIIPKSKHSANVGLGIPRSELGHGQSILSYLQWFLKRHPIAAKYFVDSTPLSQIFKVLPVGGLSRQIMNAHVLLAGDAAGTVIPTNGGGIPTAMLSGLLAGKTVVEYLRDNTPMNQYVRLLEAFLKPSISTGLLYRKMYRMFHKPDLLFHKVLNLLGASQISRIVRCTPLW